MIKVLGSWGERKAHFYHNCPFFGLQDVCRHMDSVFKELLTRQALQDSSSIISSPSAKTLQKKGKWEGRRGKEDRGSSKQ